MKHKLLLVDDDVVVLDTLKRSFRSDGFEILTAENAEEGLELLEKNQVGVIIADQRMPRMTGAEFFLKVKQLYPSIVRIMLTGYSDFEAVKEAINKDVVYKFLTKTCDTNSLREIVKEAFSLYEENNKSQELLKMEAEAEVTRMQREFLENMSHEIRTPLNGLIGFSEVLYNGLVDPHSPEHKEYLKEILDSSHRLTRLISNILNLAEMDSNNVKLALVKIDLEKSIMDVIERFHNSLSDKNIQVDINVDSSLTSIVIDREKILKIMSYLISNAIKFSENGAKIEINAFPENEKKFRLEIKDHGIGIREEDKGKLFKPFTQLDMSHSKKYQGAGIELALASRLVDMLKGKIGVESTIGKGSTFYVILPISN